MHMLTLLTHITHAHSFIYVNSYISISILQSDLNAMYELLAFKIERLIEKQVEKWRASERRMQTHWDLGACHRVKRYLYNFENVKRVGV